MPHHVTQPGWRSQASHMLLCIDTVMLVTSCCITTCQMTLSVSMPVICSIAVRDKHRPQCTPCCTGHAGTKRFKEHETARGGVRPFGLHVLQGPREENVMVDSSPEASTTVGTSIVASVSALARRFSREIPSAPESDQDRLGWQWSHEKHARLQKD